MRQGWATGTGCANLIELSSRADGGKDPVWNEKFTFHNVSADAQFLKLEVRGDEAQPESMPTVAKPHMIKAISLRAVLR